MHMHTMRAAGELSHRGTGAARFPPRVAVFGACGACARANYFPALAHYRRQLGAPLTVPLIVDLESRWSQLESLAMNWTLDRPPECLSVPDSERGCEQLSEAFIAQLDAAVARLGINTVLILTEPQSHPCYLRWAISRGLHILVEKPLYAPPGASLCPAAALRVTEVYDEIDALLRRHPPARVTVMAQRRYHPAYQWILDELRSAVSEFGIPLSHVDYFYSDGQFVLPDELDYLDHPFSQGFGKTLHGGYHGIDLLAQLLQVNELLPGKCPTKLGVAVQSRRPSDALAVMTPADLRRLFPNPGEIPDQLVARCAPGELGELDVHAQFSAAREDVFVTHASLSLLHNGFSRRAWREPAGDRYKKNGRVRLECLRVGIGPLLHLELRSYEAHETSKVVGAKLGQSADVGGTRHCVVTVFRNAGLIGGAPVSMVDFGQMRPPQLGAATFVDEGRRRLIFDFLQQPATRSDFDSHRNTNHLLSLILQGLARETQGLAPPDTADWPPGTRASVLA